MTGTHDQRAVTIELDGRDLRVEVGAVVTFGRTGAEGVDLGLADDPRLHRRCGSVLVEATGWTVENEGRWLGLRVVGLDRIGVVHLGPGERLRVPWRRARVEVHVGDRAHGFVGECPALAVPTESGRAPEGVEHGPAERDTTVTPVRIGRSTGYFRALVALCEPRLVDPSSSLVATDLEIARRLNRSGREPQRVSGKTVERRLDLCRTRFGLKHAADAPSGAGFERRDARRVLVEVALLTATVTPADLRLLAPDSPGREVAR